MHMSCSWKEQGMCICYKTEYFYKKNFIEFYYRCTCLVLGKNKVCASVIKQNIFIKKFYRVLLQMHMSCSWKEQGMCICYKTEYFYKKIL